MSVRPDSAYPPLFPAVFFRFIRKTDKKQVCLCFLTYFLSDSDVFFVCFKFITCLNIYESTTGKARKHESKKARARARGNAPYGAARSG